MLGRPIANRRAYAPKHLNEMDDLREAGRFPLPIYAGFTANVLMKILMTT